MLGGLLEGLLGSVVRLGVGMVEPPFPWSPGEAGAGDPGAVEDWLDTSSSKTAICFAALTPGFFSTAICSFTASLSFSSC